MSGVLSGVSSSSPVVAAAAAGDKGRFEATRSLCSIADKPPRLQRKLITLSNDSTQSG